MIEFGNYPKVRIDTKGRVGYYMFLGKGAIGKSYLCDLLSSNATENNFYVKTVINSKVVDFGNKDTAKLAFYDRLDLYCDDEITSEIRSLCSRIPVFVDIKDMPTLNNRVVDRSWGFSDIKLSEGLIEMGVL